MTYKQIETSREIRQWIGLAASAAFGNNLKNKAVNLFKKEREK